MSFLSRLWHLVQAWYRSAPLWKLKKGKGSGVRIGNFGAGKELKKTARGTASSSHQREVEFSTKLKELTSKFRFLAPKIGNLK